MTIALPVLSFVELRLLITPLVSSNSIPLCCLSYEIRLLITPLVSLNLSWTYALCVVSTAPSSCEVYSRQSYLILLFYDTLKVDDIFLVLSISLPISLASIIDKGNTHFLIRGAWDFHSARKKHFSEPSSVKIFFSHEKESKTFFSYHVKAFFKSLGLCHGMCMAQTCIVFSVCIHFILLFQSIANCHIRKQWMCVAVLSMVLSSGSRSRV